jgi:hypothetical protein
MSILTVLAWLVVGVLIASLVVVMAFEIDHYITMRQIKVDLASTRTHKRLTELSNHSKDLVKAFGNMRLCLRIAKAQLEKDHADYGYWYDDPRQKIAELIRQALNNPIRPLNADQWKEYL